MKKPAFAFALLLTVSSHALAAGPISCENQFLIRETQTVAQMVNYYLAYKDIIVNALKIRFEGVGDRDVYNQTSRFTTLVDGVPTEVKLGRVEPRANHESEVWVFQMTGKGVYSPVKKIAPMKMEDPFYQVIDGELFVGGVETYQDPLKPDDPKALAYRTVIYRDGGKGIDHLQLFRHGPDRMKDIRFAKLLSGPNAGKIRLVARPQDSDPAKGGPGKNSFADLDTVEDITETSIRNASILGGQVPDDEWIGTNHIYPLANGDVVYLSHVAYFTGETVMQEGKPMRVRGYFITTYSDRDPQPRVILVRSEIEGSMEPVNTRGGFKRSDLVNVLFAGGMRINNDGTATLDVGAGDAEAWEVTIKNPLERYINPPKLYKRAKP